MIDTSRHRAELVVTQKGNSNLMIADQNLMYLHPRWAYFVQFKVIAVNCLRNCWQRTHWKQKTRPMTARLIRRRVVYKCTPPTPRSMVVSLLCAARFAVFQSVIMQHELSLRRVKTIDLVINSISRLQCCIQREWSLCKTFRLMTGRVLSDAAICNIVICDTSHIFRTRLVWFWEFSRPEAKLTVCLDVLLLKLTKWQHHQINDVTKLMTSSMR